MTHAVRPFSHLEVLNEQAKPVTLGELFGDGLVVVAFIRHFGCALCEEQVADLTPHKDAIERLGARLIFIGNGNPEHARNFRRRTGAENVYTDPARLAYRAFGMRHSKLGSMGLRAARSTLRAFRSGFKQGPFEGDPWQLGGVCVVQRKFVLYGYWSEYAGDKAPVDKVLAALRRAAQP